MPLMVLASIGLIAVFLFNFYSGTDQEDNIKMAVIEPKPEQDLIKIEENVIDQTEETASIKQVRIEDSDNVQNYQMQNNEIYSKQNTYNHLFFFASFFSATFSDLFLLILKMHILDFDSSFILKHILNSL